MQPCMAWLHTLWSWTTYTGLQSSMPVLLLFRALAVAEMTGAGAVSCLRHVAGYEVAIRIGEAVTPSHYYFWHTTGTCGTFGAAAAAVKLLGLSREQMVWALGNAGTQAAGLWEFAGRLHVQTPAPGKAAQNGVLAALLAKEVLPAQHQLLRG